jgi:hypothetical protein
MKRKNSGNQPVLYCGDDSLDQAARYLYGVLARLGFRVFYVPSRRRLTGGQLRRKYAAIILSDYPSRMIERAAWPLLREQVRQGTGFLMIGGWGSFHGYDGNYQRTPLAEVLPVRCLSKDDRVNALQGAVIIPEETAGQSYPVIFGYNKVIAKKGSRTLLSVRDLKINLPGLALAREKKPLLVTGKYGAGVTACFMSDLAPHWAGGLPDWGRSKIKISSRRGQYMELGTKYVRFIQGLMSLIKQRPV